MGPLTDRQLDILAWLGKQDGPKTPAEIAWGIGIGKLPRVQGGRGQGGRGRGHRTFNVAQRIIASLTGLRKRELLERRPRPDGMSGAAYSLSRTGELFLEGVPF